MTTLTAAQMDDERIEIANLLSISESLVREGRMDEAVWRVADAALLLRQRVEPLSAGRWLVGLTEPTGRGALLPSPVKDKEVRR